MSAPFAMNSAPARFDAAAAPRRAMLAKIHIAKKALQLADDDYRAVLLRLTGKLSAGDCDTAELRTVLEDFRNKGFQPQPTSRRPAARPADHPAAAKARALWISLYHLGAIDNPAEQALEAFASRQLGVDRMQWANQAMMYKLIEALKDIGRRHGWSQDTGGARTGSGKLHVLKANLCEAILAKLKAKGLAAPQWTSIEVAAWRLLGHGGPDASAGSALTWSLGDLDVVARGLGRKLRGEA